LTSFKQFVGCFVSTGQLKFENYERVEFSRFTSPLATHPLTVLEFN